MSLEQTQKTASIKRDWEAESLAETKPRITHPLESLHQKLFDARNDQETLNGLTIVAAGATLVSGGVLFLGGSPALSLAVASVALTAETVNVKKWLPKSKEKIMELQNQITRLTKKPEVI